METAIRIGVQGLDILERHVDNEMESQHLSRCLDFRV